MIGNLLPVIDEADLACLDSRVECDQDIKGKEDVKHSIEDHEDTFLLFIDVECSMQRDQDARQNEQDPNDEIPDSLQFILWIDHQSFAPLEDIFSLVNLNGRTPGLLTLDCLAHGVR